jgi:hypothetical protein
LPVGLVEPIELFCRLLKVTLVDYVVATKHLSVSWPTIFIAVSQSTPAGISLLRQFCGAPYAPQTVYRKKQIPSELSIKARS